VWNVTNAATEITQGNSSRVMNKRAVRSAEATMMAAGPIIQGNRPGAGGQVRGVGRRILRLVLELRVAGFGSQASRTSDARASIRPKRPVPP
jgi:hypothetical protein